jgi:hypothetical protein
MYAYFSGVKGVLIHFFEVFEVSSSCITLVLNHHLPPPKSMLKSISRIEQRT